MQLDLGASSMPVAGLVPYAENARTHSSSLVAQVAASIAVLGFVNPVLVDAEGVPIAGHGRVMAAKQPGLASVPVLRLGHLSPAQARALRLADNQVAVNSGWDEALLAAEIARIRDEAVVDLDVLGFSGMALDRLLAAAYADVIVRRRQDTTGEAAVSEGDKRVFADVAAARGIIDHDVIQTAQSSAEPP